MRYIFLRFPDGKAKALTLSYDDGCVHDLRLAKIADENGIKVTFNINSGYMQNTDGRWHLSATQLKDLTAKGGHEIAVHGAWHIAPGRALGTGGINDVLECRKALEKEFKTVIRGMAYPDSGIRKISVGCSKTEIKSYLKLLGIAYARSLAGDNDDFELPEDFYEWIPTAKHTNPKLFEYLDKFLNTPISEYCAARAPMLFYLWGHSFEFNNDNNWNLIEEFCKKAGGHNDIWYATNIEICDYVNAYKALQFSAENTIVYNPTCKTVWFEADGKDYCVKPDETIML